MRPLKETGGQLSPGLADSGDRLVSQGEGRGQEKANQVQLPFSLQGMPHPSHCFSRPSHLPCPAQSAPLCE